MHFTFFFSLSSRSSSLLSKNFWVVPSGPLGPPCQNQVLGWWLAAPNWGYFKLINWADIWFGFRPDFKSEFPPSSLSKYVSSFKSQTLVIQSSYFHCPLKAQWEQGARIGNNIPNLCFKNWGWCNIHYITVSEPPVVLTWSGCRAQHAPSLSFTYTMCTCSSSLFHRAIQLAMSSDTQRKLYMCVYKSVCVCVCIYTYIYIYIVSFSKNYILFSTLLCILSMGNLKGWT